MPIGPVPTQTSVIVSWILGVSLVSAAAGFLVASKLLGLEAGAWITAGLSALSIGSFLTAFYLRFPERRVRIYRGLRGWDTRSWGKDGL